MGQYIPSRFFDTLVASYDMTAAPYFIQQPIMVPVSKTIQLGMGLWLPDALDGSAGAYGFSNGVPSSGFETPHWVNGTSDPEDPAIRQPDSPADWDNGPFFTGPLAVNYSFSPQGPLSKSTGSQDGQGPSTFAIDHDTWIDTTDTYYKDEGPKGGEFEFTFPGPPEWATSVGVGISATDGFSWGLLRGEASYSEADTTGVQFAGGQSSGFYDPRTAGIGGQWSGQQFGHNFIGGSLTVRMWAETDQLTWTDFQNGKANGGIGAITASAVYSPAYAHKLYFYELRQDSTDPGEPPDTGSACPDSPWPYTDPMIGASPGPSGTIRYDRWK